MGELVGVGVGEFGGAEGRAVDAVASGAPAQGDDAIAGLCIAGDEVRGHNPDAAAVDERVADVSVVERDRAVNGGDAHAVAVVADTGDDLCEDLARWEASGGDAVRVWVRDAEDIGGGNGLGGQAGADDVAYAAADAGGGAAVGLEGGGVVVGLDLDAHGVVVVEADDARVVDEYGLGPIEPLVDELEGRRCNGGLEEVVDGDRAVVVDLVVGARGPVDVGDVRAVVVDCCFEGLVDAVLGPGLGEGLELDVRGFTIEGDVLVADCTHLIQREEQVSLA